MLPFKFYYSSHFSLHSVRLEGAPHTQSHSPFLFILDMSDVPFQLFILTTFLGIPLSTLLPLFTMMYDFG